MIRIIIEKIERYGYLILLVAALLYGYIEGKSKGYDKGYEAGTSEIEEISYTNFTDGYHMGYEDGLNRVWEE